MKVLVECRGTSLKKLTGRRVHVGTMSRALKRIGARRGLPKPVVRCP